MRIGFILWKHQIDLAPVLLSRGALAGPIRRMVELVGDLRRPEAAGVAIVEIALDGRAQAGSAAARIGFPTGGEDHRTTEGDVRLCGLLWRALLERDHIVRELLLDARGLGVN